ncbi:Transcriptional regulator Myc-B [Acipenser ruthenus]|uniref:Transcriptional regulator Myc-B n=1 Tax=Acipenser ruthenus TaxID=7906 RepID=A0A444V829_ACIRT|nr:Transcriptional regulator Myc-B [Acipenser ruthenus]
MDFDEDEHTDDSDNDTDCLVSDSDRDSDTIEEDKIILLEIGSMGLRGEGGRVMVLFISFKDDSTDDVHPTDIPLSHVDYQGPSTLFASRVSDRAETVSPPGPREYRIVSMFGNPNPGHIENEARARQKRKTTEEQRQRQKARARQRRKEIRLNFGALQDVIGDLPSIKGKITRVVILKEATECIIRMRNSFL